MPVVIRNLRQPDVEVFGPSPLAARDRLLLTTLRTAVDKLSALEGPDPTQWSWGKIHVVHFRHPLDLLPERAWADGFGSAGHARRWLYRERHQFLRK